MRKVSSADVSNIAWKDAWQLTAQGNGYMQHVDIDRIVRLANECATVVRLRARAGDFVWKDAPLIDVFSKEKPSDEIAERFADIYGTQQH